MEILLKFIDRINIELLLDKTLHITLVLVAAWIGLKMLRKLLKRFHTVLVQRSMFSGESASESSKRIDTLMRLLRQALQLALWITVVLTVVKEIGIEIAPILAGAGIFGLAVGFGAQSLVKDVISGFFLILENQVRVGDIVSINGMTGLAEQINFRTLVLRDLSGSLHIIPNGSISSLTNMTHGWSAYVFDIGVGYSEDMNRVIEILSQTGKTMRQEKPYSDFILDDPEIFGVDKFDDSAVVIKGRIKTKPIRQWEVGREYLRRVKYAFDEQHIEIPFPQRVLSFADAGIFRDVLKNRQEQSSEHAATA